MTTTTQTTVHWFRPTINLKLCVDDHYSHLPNSCFLFSILLFQFYSEKVFPKSLQNLPSIWKINYEKIQVTSKKDVDLDSINFTEMKTSTLSRKGGKKDNDYVLRGVRVLTTRLTTLFLPNCSLSMSGTRKTLAYESTSESSKREDGRFNWWYNSTIKTKQYLQHYETPAHTGVWLQNQPFETVDHRHSYVNKVRTQ